MKLSLLLTFVLFNLTISAHTIHSVSSGKKSAIKACDKNWRTEWVSAKEKNAWIIFDLGKEQSVHGFVYIPRAYNAKGRISNYEIAISNDPANWPSATHKGTFKKQTQASYWGDRREVHETIMLKQPIKGRYLRLKALSEVNGREVFSIGEVEVITDKNNIPYKGKSLHWLKGTKMCPSIHMNYRSNECSQFYNEMKIEKSSPGTFFMACGWQGGYFGMQELANGKKVLIFSVWDSHKTNDKNALSKDKRVKLLYKHPQMRIGRFGGEGTGGQSFFDFNWKLNSTYRFLLKAAKNNDHTEYTGFFYHPDQNKWIKLVTFSTISNRLIKGTHSFVEDFRRNFDSFNIARRASFPNTATYTKGTWTFPLNGRFTKDGNPHLNINGGISDKVFFLETGGQTKNIDTKVYGSCKKKEGDKGCIQDLP